MLIVPLKRTMEEIKITLGPKETKLIMGLEKADKTVFTIEDAKGILGEEGPNVKKVIYRLKKKNRITSIERGKYILSPARAGIEGSWSEHVYNIIPAILDEYYISYWSALNYWEMTDQIPRTTYVACKISKGSLEVKEQKIKFVRLDAKKFYGYTEGSMNQQTFNIATMEKTIVDSLDKLHYTGGVKTVSKAIEVKKDEIDFDKLVEIANRFTNRSVKRRLGYLLDQLDLLTDDLELSLEENFQGYRWLDYTEDKQKFEYDKKWGLKVNLTIGDIHG